MSQNNLGIPGVGMPYPQFLTPSYLAGGSNFPPQNAISLASGQTQLIPSGTWMVVVGKYTCIQFLDPVSGVWVPLKTAPGGPKQIKSDGVNYRMANLTGCPVCAIVTNAGSGYPVTGTTVSSSGAGGSRWVAVVGGMVSSITVSTAGLGYAKPPFVFIPPPPPGGLQATAYASISNGSVSGITVTNQGGGYTSIPAVTIVPDVFDPTTSAVTAAVATIAAGGFVAQSTGSIAGVICTNPGGSVSAAPTLTIAGTGGASATAVAQRVTTITGYAVGGAGVGYTADTIVKSYGLLPSDAPVNTQPNWETRFMDPRESTSTVVTAGGTITSIGAVMDGGLYLGVAAPAVVAICNAVIATAATLTATQAGAADYVILQQC